MKLVPDTWVTSVICHVVKTYLTLLKWNHKFCLVEGFKWIKKHVYQGRVNAFHNITLINISVNVTSMLSVDLFYFA